MTISGIGTDIVSIKRISGLYKEFGDKFVQRILSNEEIKKFKAFKRKADAIGYLAKRFAGKEAVAKAFGTGIGKLSFTDISILNDGVGKPYVVISRQSSVVSKNIHISLSDEKAGYAIAFAIKEVE